MKLYLATNELNDKIYIIASNMEKAIKRYNEKFKALKIEKIEFVSECLFVGE